MNYNQAQKEAVMHREGPMLTLAGPGSGKTAVITGRVYQLIKNYGIAPSTILVVTFTRAAAGEMKERFLKRMGEKSTRVTFGTFHGVFYAILRQSYRLSGSNILSEELRKQILGKLAQQYLTEISDETDLLENLGKEISMLKNSRTAPEHFYSSVCPETEFRRVYAGYQQALREKQLLDFDDIMLYTLDLFQKRPDILKAWQKKFVYILIDEFQDINPVQYEIIRMLAKPEDNLFIVGDDDQSIYRFRGARPDLMLNFKKDYPRAEQVLLDVNYRCSGAVLKQAEKVIRHNRHRFAKQLRTENPMGAPVEIRSFLGVREELETVLERVREYVQGGGSYQEIAVLFRTNSGSRQMVEKLMEYNLPFRLRDGLPNLYEHWIARNLCSYLRLAQGDCSRREFLQIMNRPNRYISREALTEPEVSFEALYRFYRDKNWMQERLERFEADLRTLGRMRPWAAINYIRFVMGYDEYLKEYAAYRHINPDELFEVLQEIQEASRGFLGTAEWFTHMKEYTRRMEEMAKSRRIRAEGITVATLHGVKGLEFEKVFILDVNEKIMPYRKALKEEELEEERRMFYVGMTRAKKYLHLYALEERYDKKMEVSRFIREILEG